MIFAIVRSLAAVCSGDYKYQDLDGVHCVYACPSGSAADANNKCVCNAATPLISSNQRACISSCHGDEALSADSTRCYLTCPDYYFLNLAKTQCVQACKAGETHVDGGCRCEDDFKLSMDRKSCVKTCPEGQVAKQGVLTDVCACAGVTPYISSDMTKCVPDCGAGEFKMLFACVTDCNIKMHNATHCLDSCPAGQVQELVSRTCVDTCPTGQVKKNNICLCPSGKLLTYNNFCATKCDQDKLVDPYNQECVGQCQGSYLDIKSQSCIQKCPPGQILDNDYTKCICSSQTTFNLLTFTCDCPPHKLILLNNQCGDVCPSGSNMLSENGQRYCVCVNFTSSDLKSCVNECPKYQFMDITQTLCLEMCPQQFSVDLKGTKCVNDCGTNSFSNEIRKCKCEYDYFINIQETGCIKCPIDQIIMSGYCSCSGGEGSVDGEDDTGAPTLNSTTNSCACPDNQYFTPDSLSCVKSCRPSFEVQNGRCACPIGKFLAVDLIGCYTNCNFAKQQKISPDGRACYEQCAPYQVFSLFGDQCLDLCPKNSYTNVNKQCMCVSGMISLDGKSCVQFCGIGEYQWYNTTSGQIRCRCAKNLVITEGKCTCATTTLYLALDYTQCLISCPSGQQQMSNNKQLYCACFNYIASNNKSCVISCSSTDKIDNQNKRCVSTCSYPLLLSSDKVQCVLNCKVGEFISVKRTECQSSCSPGVVNEQNRCECPDSLKISLNGDKCIPQCGVGEQVLPFEQFPSCQCVTALSNINKVCQCQTGSMNLDQLTCIAVCPAYTSLNVVNGIKMCTCPKYIGIDNQSCVSDCGNNQLSIDNLHCLSICYPNIMSLDKKSCVSECGDNQTKQIQNKQQLDFMCVCNQGLILSQDQSTCLQCKFQTITNNIVSCTDMCEFPKALAPNPNISDKVQICRDSCEGRFINRVTQYCVDRCDYLNRTGNI
ncbi:ubiquitin_carboxyl-terminal hydrolase family protein [Hexamita inflata]|uniref:Ubiquitin carboxyl-terminal hydrolase family protein n=1 Tax=Hexamita inflata TaxID=28002 RepID=A0AA86P1Y9_9EUKA|nr:ubiquitin carboxyl-terminal hydrolase family protein [Hexamita inflata]